MTTQQVFLGLGSNIDPGRSVAGMLLALLRLESTLRVSRIVRTSPSGMTSPNHFLNLSVHLTTSLSLKALKESLNEIEIQLGRDRSDPLSAIKDRPADIDILFALPAEQRHIRSEQVPREPYMRAAFLELGHALGFMMPLPALPMHIGVPIRLEGRFVGLQSTLLTRGADGRLRVRPLAFRAPAYLQDHTPE